MQLVTKVNLAMLLTFALGMAASSWYAYQLTQDNALRQVTDQAELLLEHSVALRSYTVNEIRPLTENGIDKYEDFHPQTVPAYAATQVSNIFREKRPEYSYKEAVFNPTNIRDNAAPWEEKIINQFIENPELSKIVGSRIVRKKKSLYIAHPIKITNPSCLECHSTPDRAPASMVAKYGDKNGFGWKLGETIGTQMMIVPYTLPELIANQTFKSFLASTALIFLALFIVINIILHTVVIQPIKTMTEAAEKLASGDIKGAKVEIFSNDEIAVLGSSINKLRRLLAKALQRSNTQRPNL